MGTNKFITIDISSTNVKVGLVSDKLKLDSTSLKSHELINEDVDGFAKHFDMEALWNKIVICTNEVLKKNKSEEFDIIGITSCAQRMAVVFVDNTGEVILGTPNIDIRGIDSAYLIEDEFSEEDLFNITGHSPSLLFGLARLLWFQEEEEELYDKMGKVLTLDDWIVYRLTGKFCSDPTSASDTQLFDVRKGDWSSEIIEAFDFNMDLFPEIVDTGTIVGDLQSELFSQLGITQKNEIPVIKTGGDTQATLLGMGVINEGNMGLSLDTTAPIHLIVDKPTLDPNCNHWLIPYSVKGKWMIEANAGNTGTAYDWFKECFLKNSDEDPDRLIDIYLKNLKSDSETFAFLGPEIMNIKDQTYIKRGVFVFQAPSIVVEDLPKIENFAKSVIENIGFGLYENHQFLSNFTPSTNKTFCAGGLSKSNEFCKILANILDTEIQVPQCRDSAFIGSVINALVGLNHYPDHETIINELLSLDTFKVDPSSANRYKSVYKEWKGLKNTLDNL